MEEEDNFSDSENEEQTKMLFEKQKAFEDSQKRGEKALTEEEIKERRKKRIIDWGILTLGLLLLVFLFYLLVLK